VLCEAALDGRLSKVDADWDPRAAVARRARGSRYPDTVRKAT